MIAGMIPRSANKRLRHRLTLLAIAHGSVQPAPQSLAQGFGHNQILAFKTLNNPVR